MEKKILDKFFEYVKINSPSFEEKDFSQILLSDLNNLGFEVTFDNSMVETGSNVGNLIAKLNGTKTGKTIMFSAHMDAVSPCIDIEPTIDGDKVISKGNTILSSDDKSGIVAIVEGIRYVIENNIPYPNIEIVFTTCEEVGLRGSTNLDYSKIHADYSFVLDGGGKVGSIFIAGPAQSQIDITFKGKSAHAGVSPELGINAIQIAARAIDNMKLLRIDEETTANIGFINGGGPTNIVTDSVNVKLECRSLNEDKLEIQVQSIIDAINNACEDFGGSADINIEKKYPAFSLEKDSTIVKIAANSIKELDITPKILSTGGGSDTNLYNANSIPSIILSTGMEKVHTTDEYIEIEDLVNSTKLIINIIKNI